MGFEGDMDDYWDEKDPERHTRLEAALKRQKRAAENPFPPAPLPEGQKGIIMVSGFSKVEVAEGSGWSVEGLRMGK